MDITKEYLVAQRDRLVQQRTTLHNQVMAFGGAIEIVEAILADLDKKPAETPKPPTEPEA